MTLCRVRTRDHKQSVQLGTDIFTSKTIVFLEIDDDALKASWNLYKERSDVPLSFTDASTAFLAKKHSILDIFTFDKDFEALGFHVISKI